MSRQSRQAHALQDIRDGADDGTIRAKYGYPPAVIQAMRDTVRREVGYEEGPEF
ncbi:hypothetical protein [Bifidobacterium xylocopae]|uniref:hypothetical protein n=1 Tax=Bifidobacterium xylocopae TaxID=2493119 RepID=UPI0013752858|nr:hypothetical protein [Bifidobacterium xylocopae]